MPRATRGAFYSVNKGREPGVYLTWDECEAQVKGFHGAKYKKFTQLHEAQEFSGQAAHSPTKPSPAAEISPTRSGATRVSPYIRPEPVSRDELPTIPSLVRTSPSKQPVKAKSKPPVPTIPSPTKNVKWIQRETSPDVANESIWNVVYSDGACKGNGQPGSVAGIGVWWGRDDPRNLAERCPGAQTNNRAELIAIARILETTPHGKRPLLIKTDSRYSMDCFKKWLSNWIKNGFISSSGQPVKNAPLIRYISALLDARSYRGQKVRLQHIKGHAGHEGNEGADRLAGIGAGLPATEERDWTSLERALRAEENSQKRESGGSMEISVGDLEMYAEGLVDDDDLLRDLDFKFYADGLANDEELIRELAEA